LGATREEQEEQVEQVLHTEEQEEQQQLLHTASPLLLLHTRMLAADGE